MVIISFFPQQSQNNQPFRIWSPAAARDYIFRFIHRKKPKGVEGLAYPPFTYDIELGTQCLQRAGGPPCALCAFCLFHSKPTTF